jgi:hypothetical protein
VKEKGLKQEEVTGDWRKSHNEELELYFSPNIVNGH